MKLKAKILLAILLTFGVALLDYDTYLGEEPGLEAAGRATRVRSGATLPTNCDPAKGHIFFKTTSPIGLHHCLTTDTWTEVDSGGGGAGGLSFNVVQPTTGDTDKIHHKFSVAATITEISCSTDVTSSTVSINFDERVESTPNVAGTNVLSADLVCDTNTQSSCSSGCDVNTITNGSIAADAPLNLQINATSGAPGVVRIHVFTQ